MSNLNQSQRCYLSLTFLIINLVTLIAEPVSSFGKTPDFNSDFTLFGKAKMGNSNKGIFVNLSSSSGSGQIIYKKPFKFVDPKTSKPISFSTQFTFSITPGDGDSDGLAFVIFPSNDFSNVFNEGRFGISNNIDDNFVAVEFNTRKDDNVGGLNGNHVGLDVGGFESAVVSDVSSLGLVLNGGKPLKSWIDYEASMKRLEIRVGDAGGVRPYEPLISYAIDLSNMWGGRDVMVGISSSSGGSSQVNSLLSWGIRLWMVPSSLHSQPLNPNTGIGVDRIVKPEKSGFLTVLGGLIFATGCGTIVAFFVLFLWVVFFSRHSSVTPELTLNPVEFKYEKVNVTIDNGSDDPTKHELSA